MMETKSAPIAEGRTAEIFLWDKDHVLKLFRDWCPGVWVEYESGIAHAVHAAGIPSPAADEIVEVGGRRGLVYERINVNSWLPVIAAARLNENILPEREALMKIIEKDLAK